MKNIKLLKLTNFQQWKSGEIPFSPGLNVIVGNTECGKSTIFRAISSILTGKVPESYIRKGQKECKSEIEFSDDTVFYRERGKKNNIAFANGKKFERVGKEIPFEYFKELGKTNIEFGNNDLSLCLYSQFDPHFFITLSDYDKSKLIGVICGIDIVDKLMDKINSDIRQSNSNIKFLTSKIEETKPLLENYEKQFKESEKHINLLKNIKDTYEDKFKILSKLVKISQNAVLVEEQVNINVNRYNLNKQQIDAFNFKEKIDLLKKCLKMHEEISKLTESEELLKNKYHNNSLFIKIDIKEASKKLEVLNKIAIKNHECELEEAKYCAKYEALNKDINQMILEKENLLRDFDKCPLCGSILHD